jgi:FlaA1/EpsC-like NDP-sugar epimerase
VSYPVASGVLYGAAIAVAHYLALILRFEGAIPSLQLGLYGRVILPVVLVHLVGFFAWRLHRGRWRDVSLWDLRDLVVVTFAGTACSYVYVEVWRGMAAYPRSVFILGGVLTICVFGGVRLLIRFVRESSAPKAGNRVLVIGAGDAGELIVRDLRRKGHRPIGFVDDDPSKKGQTIQGIKVMGTRDDLPRIVAIEHPDQALIAIPSARPAVIRRFIGALEQFKVPITMLPPLGEIVDGKINVGHIRQIQVRDLLPRTPVHLDFERARALIEGRRVLITGAGGSIGSELSRQVARFDPDRLILYERYENNLYAVQNSLPQSFRTKAILGDITDRARLIAVFREQRPDLVFHAAAHKHVPLMELNPCEAVKNNVIGTRMVAEAAAQFAVERFILISTDKAVNPSSLMGATKRAAELVVQSLAYPSGPRYAIVRFGNVLGSNGSVIPRWLDQIAAGGPVTVTHPDVQRYFMLIPEAVELILQAAAVTRGSEIFALEMGEQINLLKMARELIRLSGFIPDEEIAINIVGLRPGEKLSEELVGIDEKVDSSPVEKIVRLKSATPCDPEALLREIAALGSFASRDQTPRVIEVLRHIVPTFEPGSLLASTAFRQSRDRVRRGARLHRRDDTMAVPVRCVTSPRVATEQRDDREHVATPARLERTRRAAGVRFVDAATANSTIPSHSVRQASDGNGNGNGNGAGHGTSSRTEVADAHGRGLAKDRAHRVGADAVAQAKPKTITPGDSARPGR